MTKTLTIGATVKIAATVNNYGNRLGVVEYIAGDAKPIYGVRLDGDNWITQFSRTEIDGPITYTVIDTNGEAISTGLTTADAAAEVLTSDSQEFDIRAAEDGNGFELWTRQQVANKGWTKTVVYSVKEDLTAAEAEIFAKVIAADWPRHPSVMTDQQYAEMQAEMAGAE